MQYLISSLIFLIPSLGMVAGLSVAATVTVFLLMSFQHLFMSFRHPFMSFLRKQESINSLPDSRFCGNDTRGIGNKIKTELLFTGWCLLSCLLAIKPINSLISFTQVFIILFGGFIISEFPSFQNRLQLKKALISGILTAILLFFIEYSSHGFLTRIFRANFALYMLDRGCALLSITSWVVMIILLSNGKKRHALMLYILVLYLLNISDSLASFLGFTAGGAIFILARFTKPIFLKLITICLILGSLLSPIIAKQINPTYLSEKYLTNYDSAAHRLFIWHFVANNIIQKPILGYGFASSKYMKVRDSEMIDYKGTKWHPLPLHPHNNILQITLELGIIGLILFLSLIYKYLKQISDIQNNNYRAVSYACFINYYIIGMISYNFWQTWWIASGIWVIVLMKLLVKPDIIIDK